MTALATDSGRKTPARLASSAILAMQSDERLVNLVRAGHERAFEAIVERYRKPLVRLCSRILPESRAEDAVQQAFINAHGALTGSDDAVQLKPWLYAITRNAALNMLRQNGWNYEQIPADFDGVRGPDQVLEQRVELQQTVAALNELPERQRDAIVMREFEGRSYDEIALALGANDGAVRQLLNRARGTLRSVASALMPPPIVHRAVASMPPSDGRRAAEIVGGMTAAGVAKAGATAVVAGSLVVGVVTAPLPIGQSHKTTREKATLSAGRPAAARDETVAARPASSQRTNALAAEPHRSDRSGRGRGGPGPAEHDRSGPSNDTRGSQEDDRSGPSNDTRGSQEDDRSGPSGDNSGPSEQTQTVDHSGPGGDGSTDGVMATLVPTGDVSGSSGTSGSGTSGSDDSLSSGSGSSGSGSDDSSGSGSSGSDDALEH